jgi:hypothetical protein
MDGGNWLVLLLVAAGGRSALREVRGGESDGASDTARDPDLDQRKHVSYRLLELVCLLLSLLPSSFLHTSCLGTLTPSFFPTFVSIATSSNRAKFQLLHSLAQRATFHPLPY